MSVRIIHGDCLEVLPTLASGSVQCVVTSPPYYGLRSYLDRGHVDKALEIGTEQTLDAYVDAMVNVFRELWRVLRGDGVAWLNIGDSYASSGAAGPNGGLAALADKYAPRLNPRNPNRDDEGKVPRPTKHIPIGYKPKDLLGIPWRVAFALQADGWYLRSDIIWNKPSCMPESVTDRPTSSHEHVFLLTKRATYFYDADAISEQSVIGEGAVRNIGPRLKGSASTRKDGDRFGVVNDGTRNARNVWTITTQPFSGAHFATMPPDLAERCIKAGSKKGDVILDPFGGAGTTALVADRLGRSAVIIELNSAYADMARNRVSNDAGLFADIA